MAITILYRYFSIFYTTAENQPLIAEFDTNSNSGANIQIASDGSDTTNENDPLRRRRSTVNGKFKNNDTKNIIRSMFDE